MLLHQHVGHVPGVERVHLTLRVRLERFEVRLDVGLKAAVAYLRPCAAAALRISRGVRCKPPGPGGRGVVRRVQFQWQALQQEGKGNRAGG